MTPDLLLVLKKKLRLMNWSMEKKRLVWCVATWSFMGALRGSEILPESRTSFNEDQTLLGRDVLVELINGEPAIVLSLKCTKEKRQPNSTSVIELYKVDRWFCPVDAFRKLLQQRKKVPERNQPLFMMGGIGYTKQMFNEDLKILFADVIDYSKHRIQTHSFRSGLTTFLARAGFTEDELKIIGRWSSASYMAYVKQGRAMNRKKMQFMCDQISLLSKTWTPGVLFV